MSEKKQSIEGKPMYVESLLTDAEYKECAHKYPNTYNFDRYQLETYHTNNFKWRHKMGDVLSTPEIVVINLRLETILKKAKLNKNG